MSAQMVAVPGGTVTLADRRTQRRWQVEVSDFELAAVPVTCEVFAEAVGGDGTDAELPVVEASWLDAVGCCNALSAAAGLESAYLVEGERVSWVAGSGGYRLPTEAEWEYACRAGSEGPRYGNLEAIAWYRGNSGGRIRPVGGKEPNAWGLFDMLGLVWEWCWDLYDPDVYGDYRVLRGGGWFDEHWSCRAGVRRRSMPTFRIDDVGFRLARSI